MGGKTQTKTTTNKPDDKAYGVYSDILDRAQEVAQRPFVPFIDSQDQFSRNILTGLDNQANQMTYYLGGQNAEARDLYNNIGQQSTVYEPYFADARSMTTQGAAAVTPEQWSREAVERYLSPYTGNVIDKTMANIQQNDALQQNRIISDAIKQGNAFGGDRMGIAQAELARNQNLASGQTIASLWDRNYSQALGQFNNQQQINLAAGQDNARRALQAGAQMGQLGSSAQQAALMGPAAQLQAMNLRNAMAGQYLANNQQHLAVANAAKESGNRPYQLWQNEQQFPYEQTGWLAGIASGIGSQMGGTSEEETEGGGGLGGILGGLLSIGAKFSDERFKDNKRVVGELFDGTPILAYNIGDGPTELGVSAQDVARRRPEAVYEIDGVLGVDYDVATENAEGLAGGFAAGGGVMPFGPDTGLGGGFIPQIRLPIGNTMPRPRGGGAGRSQDSLGPVAQKLGDMVRSKLVPGKAGVDDLATTGKDAGNSEGAVPDQSMPEETLPGVESGTDIGADIGMGFGADLGSFMPDMGFGGLEGGFGMFRHGGRVTRSEGGLVPDEELFPLPFNSEEEPASLIIPASDNDAPKFVVGGRGDAPMLTSSEPEPRGPVGAPISPPSFAPKVSLPPLEPMTSDDAFPKGSPLAPGFDEKQWLANVRDRLGPPPTQTEVAAAIARDPSLGDDAPTGLGLPPLDGDASGVAVASAPVAAPGQPEPAALGYAGEPPLPPARPVVSDPFKGLSDLPPNASPVQAPLPARQERAVAAREPIRTARPVAASIVPASIPTAVTSFFTGHEDPATTSKDASGPGTTRDRTIIERIMGRSLDDETRDFLFHLGLGMMASNRKNVLQAIGEAGLSASVMAERAAQRRREEADRALRDQQTRLNMDLTNMRISEMRTEQAQKARDEAILSGRTPPALPTPSVTLTPLPSSSESLPSIPTPKAPTPSVPVTPVSDQRRQSAPTSASAPVQASPTGAAAPISALPANPHAARISQINKLIATPGLSQNAVQRLLKERDALRQNIKYVKGQDGSLDAINEDTGEPIQLRPPRDDVEQRRLDAEKYGLKPGMPAYQAYVLTGKMPREDAQPLSASDKKAIQEADEGVLAAETAIKALGEAKTLSPIALGGWQAGRRAWLSNNLPDAMVPDKIIGSPEQGEATANLNNLVMTNALSQLKSIFGAAPTEGERKILLEIQGSIDQPDRIRQGIYDRAMRLAQTRLEFNRARAAELRGGTFYKPGDKKDGAQPSQSAPTPAPKAEPQQSGQQQAAIAKPTSAEEFQKLPSGSRFEAPDGSIRIKP